MMITAAKIATCATIDSGTVYHFCDPSFTDGFTTSPNRSRGTAQSSWLFPMAAQDREL
jgi:hypothetical protein